MAFKVATGKTAPSILLVPDWNYDFGAGVFCSFVNNISVRHDEVNRLRRRSADFVRLSDKASPLVVAHRAEHHHSIAKAQLRVSNTAAVVWHNKIFPKSENATKPFNCHWRVPIPKAGHNRGPHRYWISPLRLAR